MDRTASMKLKNTACASIIDYELVYYAYVVLVIGNKSPSWGLGSSSTTVLLLTDQCPVVQSAK